MTYTPGPWHAGEPLLIGRYLIRDDAGEIVAEITGLPWSDAETAANARLIAAAPDLLEALQRIQELVSDDDKSSMEWLDAAHDIALEAIDKAEGRQP